MSAEACPCGSGRGYAACCGRLHGGAPARTAEELMRSRFAAFAVGDAAYLVRTWDPATRPRRFDVDPDVVWRKLQIVDTVAGGPDDDEGIVEFRASFRSPDGGGLMHERSRFRRVDGRWVYVDGEQLGGK